MKIFNNIIQLSIITALTAFGIPSVLNAETVAKMPGMRPVSPPQQIPPQSTPEKTMIPETSENVPAPNARQQLKSGIYEAYSTVTKFKENVDAVTKKINDIGSRLNDDDIVNFTFQPARETQNKFMQPRNSRCSDRDHEAIKDLTKESISGIINRQTGRKLPGVFLLSSPIQTKEAGSIEIYQSSTQATALALSYIENKGLADEGEVAYLVFTSYMSGLTVDSKGTRFVSAKFVDPKLYVFGHAKSDGSAPAKCFEVISFSPNVIPATFGNVASRPTPKTVRTLTERQKSEEKSDETPTTPPTENAPDTQASPTTPAASPPTTSSPTDQTKSGPSEGDATKTDEKSATTTAPTAQGGAAPATPPKAPGKSVFGCSVGGDSSLVLLAMLCFSLLLRRRKLAYKRVS